MEDVFEQIAELIRIELLKRGFIVDVTCKSINDGVFKVKTTEFQTTPVLFSKVWLESTIARYSELESDKGVKYTDYYISLDVYYEHFDGGRNGCSLFKIRFRKFDGWDRVRIISID